MIDYRIRLLPVAKNDLLNISDYISYSLLAPDTSKRLIRGLRSSISSLCTFPYRYPIIIHETNEIIVRCMPYKNYNIFYTIMKSVRTVFILRIGYNQRNWTRILKF